MTDLKARSALFSASVEAWLLSFFSSAEAAMASRQRATTFVIHILSNGEHSGSNLGGENKEEQAGLTLGTLGQLVEITRLRC